MQLSSRIWLSDTFEIGITARGGRGGSVGSGSPTPESWNDAEIVDPARWASAAEFCKALKTVTLIRPVLSATGDGSVHVRWKPQRGQEIGAEFDAASRFWWFDADQDGVFEMEFSDLAQLIDVAKRHVPAAFERAARDAKH